MAELEARLQSALGDAYQLEREIGGGGMSRLFLATEASLNRQVVIKLLPPEMTSEVSAARFKQEIELAAQLQHPNILPVLTAGAEGDLIYYVMPYVTGESLRHRLTTEGRASIETTRKIVGQVADALAFAHAQGVVHRDIKPENILLQHGHAVLTDFGVARAVAEAQTGERLTATGLAVGTPGYMAPEQAAGETHIDARADVYALAVVAYEMLTGSPPFTGPSAQAVLAAHLTEDPKPLTEVRAETPKDLNATITKALAKEPSARLQTAAEFRDSVADMGSGAREAASPLTRAPVVGAAFAVIAIVAFLMWPRGWSYEGDPRESLIVFPFENRTGDADRDWLEEASMNLLALSLSHWEDLRVFDDERTASLMRRRDIEDASAIDFDAAQAMAQDANVGTLVMGDIRREGDEIAIEAKVHDVETGDRIATEIMRGALDDDPRALFDSLSNRVLQISGAPPGESPGVIAQTTNSVEAYRNYLRGAQLIQRFEVDSAEVYLQEAVRLDSTFALAYLQLRNVEGWKGAGGNPERQRRYVARAESHAENLPPRLRSLIQYFVRYERGDLRGARTVVQQLIARDSTDVEAWYQLGEAHFHHGPHNEIPHSDTLGNYGKALRAFERTLELDSSYVLSYRHITDALEGCSRESWRLVCLADSSVYGEVDSLNAQLGAAEVARLRQEAADRLIDVHYAWAAELPDAAIPRRMLAERLVDQQRYAEAETEAERLRETGDTNIADWLRVRALHGQRDFAAAASLTSQVLGRIGDEEFAASFITYGTAPAVLETAGRSSEAWSTYQRLFAALPIPAQRQVSLDGRRIDVPFTFLTEFMDSLQALDAPSPWFISQEQGRRAFEPLNGLQLAVFPDSADYWAAQTTTCDNPYWVTRDSAFLARWVAHVPDGLCPTARAFLALVEGDTARAEALAEDARVGFPTDPATWGEPVATEAYAFSLLLAELGRPREALAAFAKLDTVSWLGSAAPLVRSWAERAALHQSLGETQDAVVLYEQVLAALAEADETAEPFLERIRNALAAARGESGVPARR